MHFFLFKNSPFLFQIPNPLGNVAEHFLGNRFLDVVVLGRRARRCVLEKVVEARIEFDGWVLGVGC